MERLNILNKTGFLTDEDRKQPLTHQSNYFEFETCIDLSKGVRVIPYGNQSVFSVNDYSNDLAEFMIWWTNFVWKDLNGFSGFSHVKFELIGFNLK